MEKVNIHELSAEHIDEISLNVGEQVRNICDQAIEDANKILSQYGLVAKMQIVVGHPEVKQVSKF